MRSSKSRKRLIEVTGAAARSRAQVLSPDERKAELRARFAKAPARVRQLQKDTEVDPESLVRDHAKKRLTALVRSGIMTPQEVNELLSKNNSIEYIMMTVRQYETIVPTSR